MAGIIYEDLEDMGGGGATPFQFSDVRQMAAKILRRATEVAQQKIDAANRHVAELEKQAHDKGYQEGYAKGIQKGESEGRTTGHSTARKEFSTRAQGLAEVLASIALGLDERKLELQARAEADLLRLSLGIARRVVRQELHVDPTALASIVQGAISLAVSRQDVTLCVSPHDLLVIEEELPKLRQQFTDLGRVSLEAREHLQRGDVVLLTREGEIDLRIEEQFAAIERALVGSDMPPAPEETPLRRHDEPTSDPLLPPAPEPAPEPKESPKAAAAPATPPPAAENGSVPDGDSAADGRVLPLGGKLPPPPATRRPNNRPPKGRS